MTESSDEMDRIIPDTDGKKTGVSGGPQAAVIGAIGDIFVQAAANIIPVLVSSDQIRISANEPASGDLAGLIGSLAEENAFFVFREKPLTETIWVGYIGRPLALDFSQRMMGQEGAEELNEALISALVEAFNNILGAFDTSLGEEFGQTVEHADLKFLEGAPQDALQSEMGIGPDATMWLVRIPSKIDDVTGEMGFLVSDKGLGELTDKHPSMSGTGEETRAAEPDAQPKHAESPEEPEEEMTVTPEEEAVLRQEAPVAIFEELEPRKSSGDKRGIELIMDVPLSVAVELGRKKLAVREILSLAPGSLVELDKLAGETVDLLVNGKLFAKGEVVVIDENFGVRILSIITPKERIERIGG